MSHYDDLVSIKLCLLHRISGSIKAIDWTAGLMCEHTVLIRNIGRRLSTLQNMVRDLQIDHSAASAEQLLKLYEQQYNDLFFDMSEWYTDDSLDDYSDD